MNGLINRAIDRFARDTYGDALWEEEIDRLGIDETAFEPLMPCDPSITARIVTVLAGRLARMPDELLEDLGTYLVSHPRSEAVRRLLRFGGVDFAEFLDSLEELPDRARLAMPDLDLPPIALYLHEGGVCRVELGISATAGMRFGPVLVGVLRAMADDYGALVLLDYRGADARREIIEVRLLDEAFARGRSFDLGAGRAAGGPARTPLRQQPPGWCPWRCSTGSARCMSSSGRAAMSAPAVRRWRGWSPRRRSSARGSSSCSS